MSLLQLRLKNCLQTILDLESGLRENSMDVYDEDLDILKDYLKHAGSMDLVEDDVARLENATSVFLKEISHSAHWAKPLGILH